MKKLLPILLIFVISFAGCGKKEEPVEIPPEESSISESSTPEIEEFQEEEPEESPIDFDFMVDGEVNAEEIINHAHKLGLLEETWHEPNELALSNLLTAFVKSHNISENIPEAEFEELFTTFIDISLDTFHESEFYNAETKEYANEQIETSDEEGEQVLKAGEVSVVSENIYEINLIDITDENNPIDFGTLTVENNENIPKYLSFVKPVVTPEIPEPVSTAPVAPVAPATNNIPASDTSATAENSSSNATGSGTDGTTGGGTTSGTSGGTGSNDPWANFELPGDPNKSTAIGTDHSNAGWK